MKRNYSPLNSINTDFTWSISDSSIATIDSKTGTVTANNPGSATVTVSAPGGKTGTCTIKVKEKPSSGGSGGGGGGGSTSYGGSCSCRIGVCVKRANVCKNEKTTIRYQCGTKSETRSHRYQCGSTKKCTGILWWKKCTTTPKYCYKTYTIKVPKYCTATSTKRVCTQTGSCQQIEWKTYGGSTVYTTSTYNDGGRVCRAWVSHCETAGGSCNYNSGRSCW